MRSRGKAWACWALIGLIANQKSNDLQTSGGKQVLGAGTLCWALFQGQLESAGRNTGRGQIPINLLPAQCVPIQLNLHRRELCLRGRR
jgi:hypothetical protein